MKRLFTLVVFIINAVLYAQNPGNALNFDGSNDMVVVNSTPASFTNLNANDFTFEAWVNPSGSVFSRVIFVQQSTNNFATMSTNTGNTVYFYVVVNGTTYSTATNTFIPQNQWTHVACVWTASTHGLQTYFNGVLQTTIAGGTSSTGTSGLTVLGARPGGSQYFPGSMDEVRIWSEARTQCQIQSNMNSEFNSAVPNLDVYYKFNHGVAAGNNAGVTTLTTANTTFNGTLTNFALTGANSNWIASGAVINNVGPNVGIIGNTLTTSICANDTFIFGGNPLTVTGLYSDTLTASNGCDSLASINLTVLNPIISSANEVACEQFNFNNVILTSSGTYSDTLTSVTGCDSIVMLNLTINSNQTNTVAQSACDEYIFNSVILTSSGTYVDTIPSSQGCDSIITLTLTINTADVSVNQNGLVLNSLAANANYQWLDCSNNFSVLAGDTSATYSAIANGSYAVQVTQDGCTDTSACLTVNTIGLEDETRLTFTIYPNPVTEKVFVEVATELDNNLVTIMNVSGEVVATKLILKGQNNEINFSDYAAGVYFLRASVNGKSVHSKIIKK